MKKNFCSTCIEYVNDKHVVEMLQIWDQYISSMDDWENTYKGVVTNYSNDKPSYIKKHTPYQVQDDNEYIIDAIINLHNEVNKK